MPSIIAVYLLKLLLIVIFPFRSVSV